MRELTAKEVANEAALYRKSGHVDQSKRLLEAATEHFPGEICIVKEVGKLPKEHPSKIDKWGVELAKLVDRFGVPTALIVAALLAFALLPMFVPAN
ncbi:MAG: hypothetical protein GKR90_25665 [Pseudomonadales bacterium]|nr:hypothetical protein [Pseudomonadales bacterium]